MIEKAKISDLPEILQVQKQAFQPVAVVENNDRLPPLVQTLQEITVEYDRRLFLKYILDGKIVGSVRAHLKTASVRLESLSYYPSFSAGG